MGQIDEGRERRRLEELYAGMEEGELKEIAGDADSVTAVARGALRAEMLRRGMEAPAGKREAKESPASNDAGLRPVVIGQCGGVAATVVRNDTLDVAAGKSF